MENISKANSVNIKCVNTISRMLYFKPKLNKPFIVYGIKPVDLKEAVDYLFYKMPYYLPAITLDFFLDQLTEFV